MISGEKSWVIEGMAADIMIVSAVLMGADDANGSIGLFAVPTATPGVTRTPLNAIDHRGVAHVGFKHVVLASHHLIGRTGLTPSGIDAILDPLRVCIAAEMLGVADAAFQMTLDYLKMREQFGQLIGSFQALQHRASEMYMELEICRSVIEAAILACEEGNPQSTALVALAKCKMGEALDLVTNELIQMHGGIGMTDEHDAGLFFKRARVLRNLLGTPAFHRERFAGLKGI
ncbi:acyl-CoA dehydrogenase family protein [Sphingobium fuliginis]|uniref:Acyl-CoA dehydrogenase family protein n=1 Tax=Sphingobium fuliginis (strain ATCC 27551) TaxID=336203 RepID=A0A292ZAK8_SPHSA|nr:acyl-CoA dehydrogenase family protein [Sphingobium fuliginis]